MHYTNFKVLCMPCKSSTVIYCGVIIYYCITYPENSAAQQLEEEGKSLFCVQEILQSSKKERTLALLNNSIQIEQSKYECITRQ